MRLDDDSAQTGTDGRFELLPDPGRGHAARRLDVTANGFLSNRDHRWRYGDDSEQRIELRPAPTIVLRVVDGPTGAPVERYAARIVDAANWQSEHAVPLADHPGGIARVFAPPGRHLVVVIPEATGREQPAFAPIELTAGVAADVTIALWPRQQRRLIVTDGRAPGAVDVAPGAAVRRRIHLPPGWDR